MPVPSSPQRHTRTVAILVGPSTIKDGYLNFEGEAVTAKADTARALRLHISRGTWVPGPTKIPGSEHAGSSCSRLVQFACIWFLHSRVLSRCMRKRFDLLSFSVSVQLAYLSISPNSIVIKRRPRAKLRFSLVNLPHNAVHGNLGVRRIKYLTLPTLESLCDYTSCSASETPFFDYPHTPDVIITNILATRL